MSMVRRSWLAKAAGTLLLLGWLAGLQEILPTFCKLSQGCISKLKEMSSARCPLLDQQTISDQPLLLSHTGAGGMNPVTCSSPGDFPPPALFPNFSSAQEGDLILARCLVFSHVPVTHIFFCKDGVELANHLVGKGEFTSTLAIQLSAKTSGTYSCGYQRRSRLGQVMLSRLSIPWLLTTGGGKDDPRNGSVATSPELPFGGLGVSVSLAFAVLSLLALALGIHLLLQTGKRVQLARLKSFMPQ
ncbi:uncharacterized protein LOC128135789 isoform X1 [Harpia harpyja]|uniref:uncharacterized protein LOC128135789 isoform X1 n=2 Tax=Harpia harpyja TaxID=202280 RepID=UPI0022B170CC|nr:uncharacterized protein LOC128135789 isoform X1 [Harpia harpyja]